MPLKRKRPSEECRAKNFMGTLYFKEDPPADAYEQACQLFIEHVKSFSQYRGLSFQMEKAPTTGRLHLQWNILFKDKVSFTKLKTDLEVYGKSPHIEVTARPMDAWDYTSKSETRVCGPFQDGEGPKKSGQRTDLVGFVEDCKALAGFGDDKKSEEFEMKHLGVQAKYPRFYEKYVGKYEPKRSWKTRTFVFWGEPGTGKTRFAHYLFQKMAFAASDEVKKDVYSASSYPPSRSGHIAWFVGYDQHRFVLFDEYEGQYPLSLFKELTGDMMFRVKIGNGQSERQWVPLLLIICSNSDPKTWYGLRNDVFRRLDAVVHFDYSPDYPLDPSRGQDYALDVVRHSRIVAESSELSDSVVEAFKDFQSSVPAPMQDLS